MNQLPHTGQSAFFWKVLQLNSASLTTSSTEMKMRVRVMMMMFMRMMGKESISWGP